MSALAYLRAKAPSLVLLAFGIAAACLVTAVCGCPPDAVLLVAGVLTLCAAAAAAVDHLRTRGFSRTLRELTAELEHPYQLHSLVGKPRTPDQAIVCEALATMGNAAAAEVAEATAKATEHREFVEGWVHGIKAPLASCALIAGRVAEPERTQLASELDKVCRRVDAALWYARSDCAVRDYAIREVPLADIARQTCRDNARFLIEQGCQPEIDLDDAQTVLTDRKQAVFIVSQLVENAAKYGAHHLRFSAEVVDGGASRGDGGNDPIGLAAPHGDSGLTTPATPATPRGAGHIDLHVADDGRGIPAEDVGRVFERGFTGARGREGTSSTGMGLYLAARLCEQLGLGLRIASVDGERTVATVSFPLDRRRLDAQGDRTVSFA